jgi:hypothetical protein
MNDGDDFDDVDNSDDGKYKRAMPDAGGTKNLQRVTDVTVDFFCHPSSRESSLHNILFLLFLCACDRRARWLGLSPLLPASQSSTVRITSSACPEDAPDGFQLQTQFPMSSTLVETVPIQPPHTLYVGTPTVSTPRHTESPSPHEKLTAQVIVSST